MSDGGAQVKLFGGVLAYNEEERIEAAIRSLLDQRLPIDSSWVEICVVASGCTDRTTDAVREAFADEPRVQLVVHAEREGKSAAMMELFRRARGDWLVVMNGDARAEPEAVGQLMGVARAHAPIARAVMARPIAPSGIGGFSDAPPLLWGMLHQFYSEEFGRGKGEILIEELMLLHVADLPKLEKGIINDGGYLAASIRRSSGIVGYAPEARVRIAVPRTLRDYVRQRKRIRMGHHQIRTLLAIDPTTLTSEASRHPIRVARILVREAREQPRPFAALAWLVFAETLAFLTSELQPQDSESSFARWERVKVNPVPGLPNEWEPRP